MTRFMSNRKLRSLSRKVKILMKKFFMTIAQRKSVFLFILASVLKIIISVPVTRDIVLISATYFSSSTLYTPNSVVLLFNAQSNWWREKLLICKSTSDNNIDHESIALIKMAFYKHSLCSWATYIAVCQVTPDVTKLGITNFHLQSETIQIPFRKAHATKHSVISCFSPLFYNERWQLLISNLEIYRQYGVGLQIHYIQNVRTEIFNFLIAYKKAGVIDIEPWPLLNIGKDQLDDPNLNLEWRNQATAHTDCFLKYREATDFIIVSDIDDILVPKLGETYIDEFNILNNKYPFSAGFMYSRYNTQLYSTNSPADFSLHQLLTTSRISSQWEDQKSVVKTSEVQTVWLHWPVVFFKKWHIMHKVSEKENFMIHMRNWTFQNDFESRKKQLNNTSLHGQQMKNFISNRRSQKIESNAKKFILKHASNEFKLLPTNVIYYPVIEKCYDQIFYSKGKRPDVCPGHLQCKMPSNIPNVKCTVAKQNYVHNSISKYLRVHFRQTDSKFKTLLNGC